MNKIKLYWWGRIPNVGDYYSKWLVEKIMGESSVEHSDCPEFVCCGSILSVASLQPTTKVWGAGFHNENDPILIANINNYYAVRGLLSYKKLNTTKNIVLGDTGLLVSKFYKSNPIKQYKYGLVSHYIDYENIINDVNFKDFHIINMNTKDVQSTIEEIDKCEFILSSSLHGVIFAHSLEIPAIHLEFIPLASKNNFKFKDYYSVLDIKYTKETYEDNINFLDRYYEEKEKYVPSKEHIKEIQENLLKVFPY